MKMPSLAVFTGLFAFLFLTGCAGPGGGGIPAETTPAGQGVRGRLTYQGKPIAGAYVYAYRSYGTNLLGPADFSSNPTPDDGSYALDLVEGSYYLVARQRATGENTGPIVTGDLYSVHPSNPVAVSPGRYTSVDLELRQMRDPMFFQAISRTETKQGIRGVIVDKKGQPVPWVFAMAYTDSDMKRMPEFTSVMTDGSGTFELNLPKAGRYWLAARKNIREKPVSGEPYGLYEGTPDHSIQVPPGRFVEGVTIKLEAYHKGIQD